MTSAADMWRRCVRLLGVAALAATLPGCFNPADTVAEIYGTTMGSTYSIKWVEEEGVPSPDRVKGIVDQMLEEFESEASTWRPDSALSRFNRAPAGTCREMPGSIIDLVLLAQQLHAQSGGSFDLTVGPLMALWGFHGEQGPQVPDQHQITQTMQRVGQQYLRVEGSQLCKDRPLELDISGIAAGYMIDRVAERLIAMGVKSYMVEITGELKAEGVKPGGNPWRIAVEEPRDDNRVAQLVLPLRGFGISTSGDYRNYFEHEGQRYSHTFDPLSGKPVLQDLAAVTVLHPSAAWADGLSTVLLVKGSDAGWDHALAADLPALFVIREGNGFVSRSTPRFKALQQGEE